MTSNIRVEAMSAEEATTALLKLPKETLSRHQRKALAVLRKHFNVQPESDTDEESEDGGEDETSNENNDNNNNNNNSRNKRKRAKTTAAVRAPRAWGPVLKMKSLALDPSLLQALQDCDNAPRKFLNAEEVARLQNSSGAADALIDQVRFTEVLLSTGAPNNVRLAYCMLGFYDFVKRLWPKHQSGRIGPKMKRRFCESYPDFVAGLPSLDGFFEKVSGWSLHGSRLAMLCREFGDGCLFFLHAALSVDFLRDKCPTKGPHQEKAFQHLHDLGLRERVSYVKANELGSSIRKTFSDPFKNIAPVDGADT